MVGNSHQGRILNLSELASAAKKSRLSAKSSKEVAEDAFGWGPPANFSKRMWPKGPECRFDCPGQLLNNPQHPYETKFGTLHQHLGDAADPSLMATRQEPEHLREHKQRPRAAAVVAGDDDVVGCLITAMSTKCKLGDDRLFKWTGGFGATLVHAPVERSLLPRNPLQFTAPPNTFSRCNLTSLLVQF